MTTSNKVGVASIKLG